MGENLHLIVGIDPGSTSAIAVLNLKGEFLGSASKKNAGKEELVQMIMGFGKPSLLACDRTPIPELVLKIAACFNARVYSPEREMREEEKRELALLQERKMNAHERDAYAAAVKSYRAYANRLRQVELLEEFGAEMRDELKHLILNGYSLKNAILALAPKETREKIEIAKPEIKIKDLSGEIAKLARENAQLKKALANLENESANLKQRISELERGIFERLRRDSEIRKRDAEINRLRHYIEKLKKMCRTTPSQELKRLGSNKINIESIVKEYRKKKGGV